MFTLVIIIHIITCVLLVATVLLQQGKGAEIGAVFGASETLFGSSGPATFLNKLTTVVAVVFMITSLSLTYLSAHQGSESVMDEIEVTTTPAVPETRSGTEAGPLENTGEPEQDNAVQSQQKPDSAQPAGTGEVDETQDTGQTDTSRQ